jgi:hypothetical protein
VRPRPLLLLTVAVLLGCSGPRSKIIQDEGEFPNHRAIGVAPFVDSRGKGQAIADAIQAGFQQQMLGAVDQKALAAALAAAMPNGGTKLGIESIEQIRAKVPVDAIVFGRMAPDWSMAMITVDEMEIGGPILQAVLRPRNRRKKAFTDADEVAREALRVLSSVH